MNRMFKTLPMIGSACALVMTMACSETPATPTSPAGNAPGQEDAAPDGSTLKVHPPSAVSPTGGVQVNERHPTLVITNTTGRFVNRAFEYQFELLQGNNVVHSATVAQGAGGRTSYAIPTSVELGREEPYGWRARALSGGAFGPWSPTAAFISARVNRTPDPPPGQRLPLPNMFHVVIQVAQQRPDLLARSCQDHGGTWEFMDLLVDTLREVDTRWGYNWKRAIVGDPSLDVINYHYGPGPDEGSRAVYTIDVLNGHCGPTPMPAWIDITNPFGSGAMWTGRGRF